MKHNAAGEAVWFDGHEYTDSAYRAVTRLYATIGADVARAIEDAAVAEATSRRAKAVTLPHVKTAAVRLGEHGLVPMAALMQLRIEVVRVPVRDVWRQPPDPDDPEELLDEDLDGDILTSPAAADRLAHLEARLAVLELAVAALATGRG